MPLERRRKPAQKPPSANEAEKAEKLKASSEEARKDASRRAAELLARLRKL